MSVRLFFYSSGVKVWLTILVVKENFYEFDYWNKKESLYNQKAKKQKPHHEK